MIGPSRWRQIGLAFSSGLIAVVLLVGAVRSQPIESQGANIIFADSFETDLSQWVTQTAGITSQVVLTTSSVHSGTQAVALIRSESGEARMTHTLLLTTNVRVRAWIYDAGDASTGAFQIDGPTVDEYSLIAIPMSNVYTNAYGLRFGGAWIAPIGPRSIGWHQFDLIPTPDGSFGRFDGLVIDHPTLSGNLAVWVNETQTRTAAVKFISPWTPGKFVADDVEVASTPTSVDDLLLSVNTDFLRQYGNTDFSALYPTLGHAGTVPCLPDMRSLAGTAMAFALDARTNGLPQAAVSRQRAIQVISDTLAYGQWQYDDIQTTGLFYCNSLTTYELALSAWIIWWDLPPHLQTALKARVTQDADRYAVQPPHDGYANDSKAEENAWTGKFLALAANMFPAEAHAPLWESAARCFAHHAITNQPTNYCGYTTQTVHPDFTLDNHNLSPNPLYADAVLQELSGGALTYRAAGRPTPMEFGHNVVNLWNRNKQDIDWGRTYYYSVNNDANSQGWHWMGGSIAAFLSLEPILLTNGRPPINADEELRFLQRRWLINDGRVAVPTGPVPAITDTTFSPAQPSGVWFRNANQVQDGYIWGYLYHHPELLARTTQFTVTLYLPLIAHRH